MLLLPGNSSPSEEGGRGGGRGGGDGDTKIWQRIPFPPPDVNTGNDIKCRVTMLSLE